MSNNKYTLRNGRVWMILTETEAAKRLADKSDPAIQWLNGYTPHHSLAGRTAWERRVGHFVRLQLARIVDKDMDSVKRTARELTRSANTPWWS